MKDAMGNRFGEIVVREGYADRKAVQECLKIQEKLRSFGVEPKRLGEIMVEKEYLSDDDVKEILALQTNLHSGIQSRSGVRREQDELSGAEEDFRAPKQLGGYEIKELLGRGGMGAVYKARQTSLDREVAIKVLPPRAAKNRGFINRFREEARTVARLNHKNIIAGIDVDDDKGFHYFVMEYVEGKPLDKIIEEEGVLDEERALHVMIQMGRALEHAAKHNLIHRDVKPQNILVTDNDVAKLCDLGLARSAGDRASNETRGAPIGTPHYLSPEQARGEQKLDIRSDLYSLGATFFHMLTGRTPFQGQSPMVLMTKHLTEEPPSPRKLNPKVSKASADLCLALLEKEKEDRPQSPEDLLEDLERIREGKKPRAGSKRVRRQRQTERVGNRRRKAPNSGTGMDENQRRRRFAAIRAVRRNEQSFFVIFVVALVVMTGAFFYLIFKPPSIPIRKLTTPEEEESARNAFEEARRYEFENQSDRSGIMSRYRDIRSNYPGTSAADLAADRMRRME